MRFPTLLIPLTLLLLAQNPTTHAKQIDVEWFIPINMPPYSDENASVGDTISFNWPDDVLHNVFIHPTGTCIDTGAEKVGDVFDNTEYVIKESDAGSTLTFACDVGYHCEFGQKVQFTVAALTSSPTGEPTSSPTGEPSSSPAEPPTPIPTPQPTPPEDDCTEDPNAKFIVKRKNKKNLKKKCKWLAKQQKKKIRNYCKKKKGTKKIEPPKVACRITCEICEPE